MMIFQVAAASAAGAPIPGSTLLFDVPLITYEVFQYMKVTSVSLSFLNLIPGV